MRLVIAAPMYPPDIGGPATYAKLLNDNFPDYGVDVSVVNFRDVKHIPKVFRHIVYFLHVFNALRKSDVVLALDPVSVGLPACIAARLLRKPFIVKIVGDYAWEQGRQRFGIASKLDEFVKEKKVPLFVRFFRVIQTQVAVNARVVITPSVYLKDIVTLWGVSDKKIKVIFNSVHIENDGAIPSSVLNIQKPIIMTAGRLVDWKNIDGIIDAVSKIPNTVLVIVGDGPKRVQLEKYAKDRLDTRVVFTGMISNKDVIAVMKCSGVFVLNSSYEGLSHVLIEAQMIGVPIIATNVGGNPEVITHGEDGLLVSDGDVESLTESISSVLYNNGLNVKLTENSQRSSVRFSLDILVNKTLEVLNNAVNNDGL